LNDGVKLIVGLGNPGKEYVDTRHNVGASYVHAIATRNQVTLKLESKFSGLLAQVHVQDLMKNLNHSE